MKKYLFFFLFVCIVSQLVMAQRIKTSFKVAPIYALNARLKKGNISALYELSVFLDDKTRVKELLGYHVLESSLSEIAHRLIEENCLFTYDEIGRVDTVGKRSFLAFLKQHRKSIVFSSVANAFLIVPPEQRESKIEFRRLPMITKLELEAEGGELLSPSWIEAEGIDTLIAQRNPLVLLRIASAYYKTRHRFNNYSFNGKEYTRLLQYLTGIEIGLGDETKEISWLYDDGICDRCKLNLLIFFAKNYRNFYWDNQLSVFVNTGIQVRALSPEEEDFKLLTNKNGKMAADAFARLAEGDPIKVGVLAEAYDKPFSRVNDMLPWFSYSFLKQLPLLTAWCKAQDIDYRGSEQLREYIRLLQTKLSFAERRKLENQLIVSLSPDDITAFEYNILLYAEGDEFSYSAGRILDIFYSRNWDKIFNNKKQLDCYLKKSALFGRLGIAGTCNDYIQKCIPVPAVDRVKWEHYETEDVDIKKQVRWILKPCNSADSLLLSRTGTGNADEKVEVAHLEQRLKQLTSVVVDSARTEDALVKLLERVSYRQIPVALQVIEPWVYRYKWNKYEFITRGWLYWGLFNFDDSKDREAFTTLYNRFTEYQFVEYLVDSLGIDYKTAEGKLDYDKIYDLLKFNIVTSFVGGLSGIKEREVYAVLRMLELTFSTTLGYPDKLVHAENGKYYTVRDRAVIWRRYLEQHGLLKLVHTGPESFRWYESLKTDQNDDLQLLLK